MAVKTSTITLRTPDELPLTLDLRHRPEGEPKAAVIVCHGFKGFKRWGFFPYLAEQLAEAGLLSIALDFSHNGIGDDPEQFGRLDLFRSNTYSREIRDLEQAIDWLRTESPFAATAEALPLGLLGHSRGALPVLVVAAERGEVRAVVTWNGVGSALRFTERQLDRWEEDGEMAFTNARTGQRMTMDYGFVVDAREHSGRFDPAAAGRRMQAAQLIVHGTKDLAVDFMESDLLLAGRSESDTCRRVAIEGGAHTLGAVHPFEQTTPHLEQAIKLSIEWFSTHLGAR